MSQAQIDVSRLNETVREESLQVQAAVAEMKKVIVGQRSLLDRMMVALLCRGHLLVEGVPGLAKTLAVKTLGQVLALQFSRIQFTPDLLPADLIGTLVYSPKTGEFSARTWSPDSTRATLGTSPPIMRSRIWRSSSRLG